MKIKKLGFLAVMICLVAANTLGCSKKTDNTYETLVMAQKKTRQITAGDAHVSLNIIPKNGVLNELNSERNTEIDFSFSNQSEGLLYTYNAVSTYEGESTTLSYERKKDGLYDLTTEMKYEGDSNSEPNHLESVLSYFSFEYKENEIDKVTIEETDGYKVYVVIPKKSGNFETKCKYWIKDGSVLKVEREMIEEFDVNGVKDTVTTTYTGEIIPK